MEKLRPPEMRIAASNLIENCTDTFRQVRQEQEGNMEECGCDHNMENLVKWQNEQMQKHGWYIHYVSDSQVCNLHTHGIQESFKHPDFQIVIPLPPQVANSIFHRLVNLIKEGRKFALDQVADEIIGNNMQVKFIEANEGDRKVLRVVLPDKNGKLDPTEQEPLFADQYLA